MMGLNELYCFAEKEGITVDCFKLHEKEALSLMDSNNECYIVIDPFQLSSSQDEKLKLLALKAKLKNIKSVSFRKFSMRGISFYLLGNGCCSVYLMLRIP